MCNSKLIDFISIPKFKSSTQYGITPIVQASAYDWNFRKSQHQKKRLRTSTLARQAMQAYSII